MKKQSIRRKQKRSRAVVGFAGLMLMAGLASPGPVLRADDNSDNIRIVRDQAGSPASGSALQAALLSDASEESLISAQQPRAAGPPKRPEPSKRPAIPTPARPAPQLAAEGAFATSGANQSLGGASTQTATSSYMIGDFFSSSGQIIVANSDGTPGGGPVVVGEIPSAGGSRRIKISENNSPIPRDRVFYSFNYFDNAIQAPDRLLDVARHTPGFEKTFLDGLGSFEARLPIAYTQNSDVFVDNSNEHALKNTEIGNLSLVLKVLLARTDDFALAVGTGVNLPTGDDTRVFLFDEPYLRINNDAVHVLPYIGAAWYPNDKFYFQSYLQVDVDAGGNGVFNSAGQRAGVLNEQTLLYADFAIGYWLMRDDSAQFLTGVIPTVEYHYTTSVQDADILRFQNDGDPIVLGNIVNRFDVSNLTAGTLLRFGPLSFVTIAGVFPLQARDDQRQFDSEIVVQLNRLF